MERKRERERAIYLKSKLKFITLFFGNERKRRRKVKERGHEKKRGKKKREKVRRVRE